MRKQCGGYVWFQTWEHESNSPASLRIQAVAVYKNVKPISRLVHETVLKNLHAVNSGGGALRRQTFNGITANPETPQKHPCIHDCPRISYLSKLKTHLSTNLFHHSLLAPTWTAFSGLYWTWLTLLNDFLCLVTFLSFYLGHAVD